MSISSAINASNSKQQLLTSQQSSLQQKNIRNFSENLSELFRKSLGTF
ncbi:hypothetical protein HMPREF1869_01791 [Bacteroidales bacterium KA00251]|nr:hypothetical protein HMPREF1869_01791 [Bacteroidales bacterium KA00251]